MERRGTQMANYAEIINGKVNQVVVFNGTEVEALIWLTENVSSNKWVLTKEDGSMRGKYAGIGDEYHSDINIFIRKPFDSWTLDKNRKMYIPDISKPIAIVVGYIWKWSIQLKDWVKIKARNI